MDQGRSRKIEYRGSGGKGKKEKTCVTKFVAIKILLILFAIQIS